MKKILSSLFIILSLTAVLILPFFVFAANPLENLQKAGSGAYQTEGVDEFTLAAFIGQIISVILGLLGVIFVVLIIISGYQWMTAGGNEDAIKKAQGRITNAIIGLVITLSVYAIWNLIAKYLL